MAISSIHVTPSKHEARVPGSGWVSHAAPASLDPGGHPSPPFLNTAEVDVRKALLSAQMAGWELPLNSGHK